MAIELTRERLRSMMGGDRRSLHVSPRTLVSLVAAVLAISFTSALLGAREARLDEDAARVRLADAEALLALPPVSSADLRAQLEQAKAQIATFDTSEDEPAIDLGSDAATTVLVLHSQAAGLAVKGISRINPASAKFASGSYEVQGLRITVEGAPAQVVSFLADMHRTEPSLIASLATLSIAESGAVHADVGFSVYTKDVSPTPAPRAAATPGVKR